MSVIVQPPVSTEPQPPQAPLVPAAPAPGGWTDHLTRRNVLLGLLAVWLLSGVYLVAADEQAVVTRFGKVTEDRVLPGIHVTWPFPISRVHKLKVRQTQRAVIGGDPADEVLGRSDPLQSQFLTGDQNIINVRSVVQYSVATPADYLFRAQDVANAVGAAVETELGRQFAARTVDEVLTTEKVAIQEIVRQRSQALLDSYGLGVGLASVSIEQIAPPPEAADAFRDVASARADSARIVSEAEGYSNDIVPRARGEARQMLESAEAYKQRIINEARGDASRFSQLAAEIGSSPDVTRARLYIEAMEQILPRLKKTIVDSSGNLDLTIVRGQKSGQRGAGAIANPAPSNPAQPPQ